MVVCGGGTALAATLALIGGRCVGGDGPDGPDTMYGSVVRDEIYSLKGGPRPRERRRDFVNGDGGDDTVNGEDS